MRNQSGAQLRNLKNIKVKIEVSLDLLKNQETHRSMEEIQINNHDPNFIENNKNLKKKESQPNCLSPNYIKKAFPDW